MKVEVSDVGSSGVAAADWLQQSPANGLTPYGQQFFLGQESDSSVVLGHGQHFIHEVDEAESPLVVVVLLPIGSSSSTHHTLLTTECTEPCIRRGGRPHNLGVVWVDSFRVKWASSL